jgi:hypothetical protein
MSPCTYLCRVVLAHVELFGNLSGVCRVGPIVFDWLIFIRRLGTSHVLPDDLPDDWTHHMFVLPIKRGSLRPCSDEEKERCSQQVDGQRNSVDRPVPQFPTHDRHRSFHHPCPGLCFQISLPSLSHITSIRHLHSRVSTLYIFSRMAPPQPP